MHEMATFGKLAKDYLMINFHFVDIYIQNIEISHMFIDMFLNITDMFIHINVGLFLGVSFMSFFEIADQIAKFLGCLAVVIKKRTLHICPVVRPVNEKICVYIARSGNPGVVKQFVKSNNLVFQGLTSTK